MKPKRKGSHVKQNKEMIRRLMELSLKIDDYIYNKKRTIVPEDAALYIQEITLYKEQCNLDERILQVIEKLVRCMTRIITEDEEDTSSNTSEYNEFNQNFTENTCVQSPVYSLPDEHKMYFQTKSDNIRNSIIQTDKKKDIFQMIDPRNDNIGTKIIATDLQKVISNLSLEEKSTNNDVNKEKESEVNFSVECSPSILNEFEFNQSNYNLSPVKRTITKSLNDKPFVESSISGNLKEIKTSTTDTESSLYNNTIQIQNNSASNSNTDYKNTKTKREKRKIVKNQINIKAQKTVKSNADEKEQKTVKSNANKKEQKTVKSDVNKKEQKTVKSNANETEQKTVKNEANREAQNIVKIKTNRKTRKTVKTDNKNKKKDVKKRKGKTLTPIENVKKVEMKKAQKEVKHSIPIDGFQHTNNNNSNTMDVLDPNEFIDDLSWIENMRFVREISEDEYDPNLQGLDWINGTVLSISDQDFVYN